MSAISEFINTIRNAIYGEQVRGAIANAIEQCYNDVSSPSLNTTAFETALRTVYAEGILDIQTVTTIAAMTNQQIIYRYNGTETGRPKGLYYYDGTDWKPIGSGVQTVASASLMTDANAIYKYTGNQQGYVQNALYYYNGTSWIPVSPVPDTTLSQQAVPADAKAVGDAMNLGGRNMKGSLVANSYVSKTGVITNYQNWSRTGYVEIPTGLQALTYVSTLASEYCCFYDENKDFLSNFSIQKTGGEEKTIAVPTGAKYVIFSNYTSTMENFRLVEKWEFLQDFSSNGNLITNDLKQVLLELFNSVAWSVDNGATKVAALASVLYPSSGISNMEQWSHGVAYTDIPVTDGEYYRARDGAIDTYNGWSRSAKMPCKGAKTIVFPPLPQTDGQQPASNCFWDSSGSYVSSFTLSLTTSKIINVPSNAATFGISSTTQAVSTCLSNGIVPKAY